MFALLGILPSPSPEESAEMLIKGLNKYAAEGITTCQEGAALPSAIEFFEALKSTGKLPIDIVSYPLYKGVNDSLLDVIANEADEPGPLTTPGIKLVTDGSIQGYTAFLSQPYHVIPDNLKDLDGDQCENDMGEKIITGDTLYNEGNGMVYAMGQSRLLNKYRGYANMTSESIAEWVRKCDERGIQMLIHCNGDAALDNVIAALDSVRGESPRPDLRTTIIHAQTARDEQIDYAAANGLILSFFPIHVKFWGDRHKRLFLGPERAERINPANSALQKGATFTLHHDAPVAQWGMLPVVSAAVNRITSGGELLGPDERISPYQALCAVTRDAAFQSFEEERKGTLEVGKLADLVILDKNPITIDPLEIEKIKVVETIKEGQKVYKGNQ